MPTSAVGSYRVMVQKLIHGGKVDEFALVEDKHEFVLTGLGEKILPLASFSGRRF